MKSSIGGSKIIFVGGIHGVGKSSICREACDSTGVTHLVASDLIRSMGRESDDGNKRVKSVDQNQDVLVHALHRFVNLNVCYLLDGHFALFNSDGTISEIPVSTFQSIAPVAAFFIYDDPASIEERLGKRDQKRFSISLGSHRNRAETKSRTSWEEPVLNAVETVPRESPSTIAIR